MSEAVRPNFQSDELPWEPASYWREGDYDPRSLVASLKEQPELCDYVDDAGNAQSRVRLDVDEGGLWVTVPADTPESAVDAGVAAYVELGPEPNPDPIAERLTSALDTIDLGSIATPADLVAALKAALAN